MKRNRGGRRRNYFQQVASDERKRAQLLKKEERIYGSWPAETGNPVEAFEEAAPDCGVMESDRQMYLLVEKALSVTSIWIGDVWKSLRGNKFLRWVVLLAIAGIIACVFFPSLLR